MSDIWLSSLLSADPAGACNAPLRRELPQRRSVRLPGYDYSQAGWYFVTVMTQEGRHLFGRLAPETGMTFSHIGEVVCQSWLDLTAQYPQIHADARVVMPNHFHAVVGLSATNGRMIAKSLGQLLTAFKATTTRLTRPLRNSATSLWQRGYYEHVTRNAQELDVYREYIRNNPRRWLEKKTGFYDTSAT